MNREMSPDTISFWVPGKPEPAGSKSAYPSRNGRHVRVVDANRRASAWKDVVAMVARAQYRGQPLTGPVRLDLQFYLRRPPTHMGRGRNAKRVLSSAREHATVKPDALKLARAVEDALTGILYADDAQIIDEHLLKFYGPREGVRIEVRALGIPEEPARVPASQPIPGNLTNSQKELS